MKNDFTDEMALRNAKHPQVPDITSKGNHLLNGQPTQYPPTLGKLPCQARLHLAVGTNQDIVYLNRWIASRSLQLLSRRADLNRVS